MKIFPPSQKSRTSGFRARNLGKQFSGQPNIYTYKGKFNFESVRPKENVLELRAFYTLLEFFCYILEIFRKNIFFTQIHINVKIINEFEFAYDFSPIRAILIEKSQFQAFHCPKTKNS